MLRAMRADTRRAMDEMGMDAGDPYILGTQVPDSRPYNPMQLGKDFSAFCRMDGFFPHVPRPVPHVRHHDDRGWL